MGGSTEHDVAQGLQAQVRQLQHDAVIVPCFCAEHQEATEDPDNAARCAESTSVL